jgi:hypothetical protein
MFNNVVFLMTGLLDMNILFSHVNFVWRYAGWHADFGHEYRNPCDINLFVLLYILVVSTNKLEVYIVFQDVHVKRVPR